MKRFWWMTFGVIIMLTGCSSAVPTLTPTALVPTPTVTALPPVPTLNPDVFLLPPNQGYVAMIYFLHPDPALVQIFEPYPSDKKITFHLGAQGSDAYNNSFALLEQSGDDWGMPYLIYALNNQPGHNTPSSTSIQSTLLLSPDKQSLALFLCNEYGGRGQWCGEQRLWIFDLLTSTTRFIELADLGVLYVGKMRFSDDGQTLTGDSCMEYANAYFGHCGMNVVMTWDVATGRLLDKSLPTPQNEGLSS